MHISLVINVSRCQPLPRFETGVRIIPVRTPAHCIRLALNRIPAFWIECQPNAMCWHSIEYLHFRPRFTEVKFQTSTEVDIVPLVTTGIGMLHMPGLFDRCKVLSIAGPVAL